MEEEQRRYEERQSQRQRQRWVQQQRLYQRQLQVMQGDQHTEEPRRREPGEGAPDDAPAHAEGGRRDGDGEGAGGAHGGPEGLDARDARPLADVSDFIPEHLLSESTSDAMAEMFGIEPGMSVDLEDIMMLEAIWQSLHVSNAAAGGEDAADEGADGSHRDARGDDEGAVSSGEGASATAQREARGGGSSLADGDPAPAAIDGCGAAGAAEEEAVPTPGADVIGGGAAPERPPSPAAGDDGATMPASVQSIESDIEDMLRGVVAVEPPSAAAATADAAPAERERDADDLLSSRVEGEFEVEVQGEEGGASGCAGPVRDDVAGGVPRDAPSTEDPAPGVGESGAAGAEAPSPAGPAHGADGAQKEEGGETVVQKHAGDDTGAPAPADEQVAPAAG